MGNVRKIRDSISIKDDLSGPISQVIDRLIALVGKYPDGEINVTTDYEYGESYAAAYLSFRRDETSIEAELRAVKDKADLLDAFGKEKSAFDANGAKYPRAAEVEALRKELGFFAMSPKRAILQIFNGEIVVYDLMTGGRRRDGTFVFRTLGPMTDKMQEEIDRVYKHDPAL